MTTLKNRPNAALIVIDVQNGVVGGTCDREMVISNIHKLVEKARGQMAPIIWVQHDDEELKKGSNEWEIVPELSPGDAEPLVYKQYGDAFEETHLESVLSDLGVGRLIVVGAHSDFCIRSTMHGAFTRGYDVTLVCDAHTTEDLTQWGTPSPRLVISHTNFYWAQQRAPERTAETLETESVEF
jgi:nicotinamidase-related amidase